MVASINLKFKHMNSRIEKSSNGYSASINRSKTNYHSYGINSIQTKFSKLNFQNFESRNWELGKGRIAFLTFKRKGLRKVSRVRG